MRSTLRRRVLPGALLCALLAACADRQTSGTTSSGAATPVGSGQVGYVSLDRLVKKHPLYGQLSRLDEDMEALRLKAVVSSVAVSSDDLARAQRDLRSELEAAAAHAQAVMKAKQNEIQDREKAAIAAALRAAVPANGTSIGAGIDARLSQQQSRVRSEAAQDFDSYRRQVLAQDQAALTSLETSYQARAAREYHARAVELQAAESAYALKLSDDDKSDRLSLRTKLSNLPLDDAERQATRDELAALDRKEGDALGGMRNRDQATLAELQTTLHTRVKNEIDASVRELRAKTVAKIDAHAKTTQAITVAASGATGASSVPGGAGLPPDMQARLKALQAKFQNDYDAEANQTIAAFQKTKRDLAARFAKLRALNDGADASTQKQLDLLEKQRGSLYDAMIAQIKREVRSVAQKRGIDVVFSDVVAPAGGVDLTPDAEKDIESLPQ